MSRPALIPFAKKNTKVLNSQKRMLSGLTGNAIICKGGLVIAQFSLRCKLAISTFIDILLRNVYLAMNLQYYHQSSLHCALVPRIPAAPHDVYATTLGETVYDGKGIVISILDTITNSIIKHGGHRERRKQICVGGQKFPGALFWKKGHSLLH